MADKKIMNQSMEELAEEENDKLQAAALDEEIRKAQEEKKRAELAKLQREAELARRAALIGTTETMDDYKAELEHSFRRLEEGDIVRGTVIGVSETEVTVDLGSYSEGIIKIEELSNDPRFSIKADIHIGDIVSARVIRETRAGSILLSLKQADDMLAWDKLRGMQRDRTVSRVKVAEAVKGGVTTFLCGIRAFIPASQIALSYVEDTSEYVNKELSVIVTEVNEEDKKLVLSAKEVAREKAAAERTGRISKLQIGLVTEGKVEKLMPFGAFVNIGEELTGLVHISQICGRKIKSPAEVLKVDDVVTVKVIAVKDGKISLSMTAVEEKEEVLEDVIEEAPTEYSDGESATTGLGALLAGLKL